MTEVTFQKSQAERNLVLTTENSIVEGLNLSAALGEEILEEFPEERLQRPNYNSQTTPHRIQYDHLEQKQSSDSMDACDESPLIITKNKN